MAVITANGISSHLLGGTSDWPPNEFQLLSLSGMSVQQVAPPPFNVYPSWRRPWRLIKAN